jgi:predicted ATPase
VITRLEAIRYRCFERLGIDLGGFQVIVGANGAGKTTLIDMPVLMGELLKADNLATVFVVKRGEKPARAGTLRELIFAGRGDEFSFALEVKLPEDVRKAVLDGMRHTGQKSRGRRLRTEPQRWPTHIRYELRLEVFNDRELNVKNEYLFTFPESAGPDRAIGGLHGERSDPPDDWHFILRREYGGPAEVATEVDSIQNNTTRSERVRIKPNLLAMSTVKYRPDAYPSANWLYVLLTEGAVFLEPEWEMLREASALGQEKTVVASALNMPWLALDMKLSGLKPDATPDEKAHHRSQDYVDWVDHVRTALPQVEDIDVREREEDHRAYFSVRFSGGYNVTSSGLSDGTLRILTLTLMAYVANPPRLLVTEEPENGIHPGAIESILQSLSSLYDSQVWVSSHSPVVLASSRLDQVLCARLTKSGGVEVVPGNEHPRLKGWHGAIDLGSLFAAGILG